MDKQFLFVFVIQTIKQEWNTSIHTAQNILVTFWWAKCEHGFFFGPHAIMGEKPPWTFSLKKQNVTLNEFRALFKYSAKALLREIPPFPLVVLTVNVYLRWVNTSHLTIIDPFKFRSASLASVGFLWLSFINLHTFQWNICHHSSKSSKKIFPNPCSFNTLS